jgi:hypothetical protein
MTKRTALTQAQYGRMIKAAMASGLRVAGLMLDGIVTYQDGENPLVPIVSGAVDNPKGDGLKSWDEAIAELESHK